MSCYSLSCPFIQRGTTEPLPVVRGSTHSTFTLVQPPRALLVLTLAQARFPFGDEKIEQSRSPEKDVKRYVYFGLLAFNKMNLKVKDKHMK